jgi:hypothetical protein
MVQRPPGSDDSTGNGGTAPADSASADKPRGLDPETTLDLMKALENAAIVIDEPAPRAPEPKPEPSYNPYDRGPAKPPRK